MTYVMTFLAGMQGNKVVTSIMNQKLQYSEVVLMIIILYLAHLYSKNN